MMNQDIRNAEPIDEEISLWELIDQLKHGWQWLLGGGAVGVIGAISFVFLTSPQYEASVTIQPATIGLNAATTAVEPAAQTLERLKLVTFYNDDIVKTCGADSAKELAKGVKPQLIKGNNLLSISYRAGSAALAHACVSKIVAQLTQSQAAIAAPLIKELQMQQTSTKQQIDEVERFLSANEKRVASSPTSNELATLLMLKRGDLSNLQRLYREQRMQMTEPLTQSMKPLEPIYVPEKPVTHKLVTVAGGLVGGLLAGLLALFVNRSLRRYKAMST